MKNHKANNYIISKISAMLLALALCLSMVMPMAGMDVYAAKDGKTSVSASEAKAAKAEAKKAETSITGYKKSYNKRYHQALNIEADITPADGREVQLQRYNSEAKSWTTIMTATAGTSDEEEELDENAIIEEVESSAAEENALVAEVEGSIADATPVEATSDAASQTAENSGAAENAEATSADSNEDLDGEEEDDDEIAHVTFEVPKEERQKTTSTWRIYVPATKDAAEAGSSKITVITRNLEDISMTARAACIYRIDGDGEGTMIFSRNSSTKVAQASTTKLMTAVLLIESGLLDSTTRVSAHAAATPYASGRMAVGDAFNTRDLLYAMLLPSSNDAATAVAERVGGNEAAFVNMMNAKAEKLGLTKTHFRNPHGLDADGHYTTAKELAKLTAYAYTFPEIRDCWATQYKSIKSLEKGRRWNLWSTNAIFGYVSNFLGGKTGTESNAGCCFTGVYTFNGGTYVTVVLGSGYGFSRWSDTKKLHKYIQDYALSSY